MNAPTFDANSLASLAERTAYEGWLLEEAYRIDDNLVVSPERDHVIFAPDLQLVKHFGYMAANFKLGDWRPGFLEACAPLVFGTAFKLLDMTLEWVLIENGRKATFRFEEKIKAVKDPALVFPPLLASRMWLRERLVALYEQLDPLRGTVIHDREFESVAGGLSVSSSRKGVVGPRVTITAEDLRNLADLFTRVRRYLLGDWQVDAFREKRMRFACDQLAGLHGIVSLGQQSPVFSPVRLYHVEAEPLVVDLDALRDAVRARHANQDAVFDLCLVTLHEGAMVDAMRLLWPQLQGATLTITGAERGALRVLVPADYER